MGRSSKVLIAVTICVIGVALLAFGLTRNSVRSLPGPVSSSHIVGTTPLAPATLSWNPTINFPVLPSTSVPTPLFRSPPVSIQIPAIGVSATMGPSLGLTPSGAPAVAPVTDVAHPWWYNLGPTPGDLGNSVIMGHVDNTTGPGAFYNLHELVPGDLITVPLADGDVTTFKVTSVVQYLKTGFPDQLVYGASSTSDLNLVTCGGQFDSATGHYLSSIVVYTQLESVS